MKILSAKTHGVLDYVVVLVFLLSPSLLHLNGTPAFLSYALAAVHLIVTLLTDFPMGAFKVIPLPIHGWIELAVAPTLIAIPWILGFSQQTAAKGFFIAVGIVIFATWLITDYRTSV